MNTERWAQVRALVESALSLPASERIAFLAEHAADPEVREEARHLLDFADDASAIFPIENWQTASAGATLPALEGTDLGNYRLIREIGRGGMGAVYLAERSDGLYDHQVALKVLQEGIVSPNLVARFRDERQILARLNHPGIARLLDGGVTQDGRPYLVLEYVDGQPIDQFARTANLNIHDRLRLFLKVAEAVQSAHQQFVLHLDLKPANILVTAAGEPRLLDFGISRIFSPENPAADDLATTVRLMTPRFASPEQAACLPLGVASDVFSLATVLYLLLTGRLPYAIEGVPPLEAAQIIRDTPPSPPSEVAPPELRQSLRGDLDTILLQALRKEPERRYPTVAAFAADITRHLAFEPVLAHADSFHYRLRKFIARNTVAVSAAAFAALILLLSTVAVIRYAIRTRRAEVTAERRFNDVRALAHSYVFDLQPALNDIPGSIHVRAMVLQNANRYLEAMSLEKTDDESLLRELAEGYTAMGRVQSAPGQPSLSDPVGAMQSQLKAIAIERQLLAKHPENLEDRVRLLRQLTSMSQVYEVTDDLGTREALDTEAWAVGQPVLAAGPDAKGYLYVFGPAGMLATIRSGSGDDWSLADPVGAIPWADRAQAILDTWKAAHPGAPPNKLLLQNAQYVAYAKAYSLSQMDRWDDTHRAFEAALALPSSAGNGLTEDIRHKTLRFTWVVLLLEHHETAEASRVLRSTATAGVHERGNDALQQSGDADELVLQAHIDLREGRVAEGIREMNAALAVGQKMAEEERGNAVFEAGLAWTLLRLADETALPAAQRRDFYERSRKAAEEFLLKQPTALTAAMVAGRCNLGMARIAAAEGRSGDAKALAQASAGLFKRVLEAHPVQPEASGFLAQAAALSL